MTFTIDHTLIDHARAAFANRRLYWLLGGSGSGKTTLSAHLAAQYDLPLYDMDAHIYGSYFGRFTPQRHPANSAWAAAEDGLAWLLALSWADFDQFHRAALAEYLDLLAEDLRDGDPAAPLLIDGGVWHPALLVEAIPPRHIACLSRPDYSSEAVWTGSDERLAMKAMIDQLPHPEQTWQIFLDYDRRITETLLREARASEVPVLAAAADESVAAFAGRVASTLQLSG